MWNLMIVGSLPSRPLILVGRAWNHLMDTFFEDLGEYSPAAQRGLVLFASTAQVAVEIIDKATG
jgi:hypothetical protein